MIDNEDPLDHQPHSGLQYIATIEGINIEIWPSTVLIREKLGTGQMYALRREAFEDKLKEMDITSYRDLTFGQIKTLIKEAEPVEWEK